MNHPNLSAELNKAISDSEEAGGVFLKNVPVGFEVKVQTRNTLYRIFKRGEDDFTIQGNAKYCPEPTKAYISGSTFGGSMLKVGFIGVGMYLEFTTDEYRALGRIITSQIRAIEVQPPSIAEKAA